MPDFNDTFIKTVNAERAFEMCKTVLNAREYSRIGQIIGDPGTGKSRTTKWLAEELNGVRIEAWAGINAKELFVLLVEELNTQGHAIDPQGTSNSLFYKLKQVVNGKLIIVDEANHLSWQVLERLRALSDQSGAAVILSGTDILERRFKDARVRIYLKQLAQRIGAKRVYFNRFMDDGEFAHFVITPRFGQVAQTTAARFRQRSRGNWRMALELGDAIERVMEMEGSNKLTIGMVETAASFLAGQDFGGAEQ